MTMETAAGRGTGCQWCGDGRKEFVWHHGLGVSSVCRQCARRRLRYQRLLTVTREEAIGGYVTPYGRGRPRIFTEEELSDYDENTGGEDDAT